MRIRKNKENTLSLVYLLGIGILRTRYRLGYYKNKRK